MNKRKLNIAVTGLNAIDSPGPGVAVIRALKESTAFEARITGLCYESLEPGIYMHDLVDKTYKLPPPALGKDALLRRLEQIHAEEPIDVIIPNFDAELFSFIQLADQLKEKLNIHTFLPTADQFEARHKVNLADYGKQHGIKVPKGKVIFTINELIQAENDFSFPIVVKGKFYDASIAYNREQAVAAFHKISAKWGLPIILQEFISGEEVNVTAIGDGKGNTVGAVPMKKQYITDKGKAWAGISIDDDNLMQMTHQLMKSVKWRGGMELEIVKTEEDEYYLLEINPRFPAWVYLAVGCGQNHPEALVRLAMGEEVAPWTSYDIGKLFIRYSWDMIVNLDAFMKISTLGQL